MKKIFLFFVFLFVSPILFAQSTPKVVNDQTQAWLGYLNQTRLTDKWGIWLDLHARRTEDFLDRWSTTIIRPGVTYYFSDHLRFTVGYAFVSHYQANTSYEVRPEHRPWQQILWTHRGKRLQTQQWVRLEERYMSKYDNAKGEVLDGYSFNFRFRYLLNLMIPLNREFIEPQTLFVAFNDEIHINAGSQITYNYFDQNRLFLGMGYQFSKTLNAQLGYMNLFQQLPAGNQFNNIHAVRLFFFHNLDLRKKDG